MYKFFMCIATLAVLATACNKEPRITVQELTGALPQPSVWVSADMNRDFDTLYIRSATQAEFRGRFVKDFLYRPTGSGIGLFYRTTAPDTVSRPFTLLNDSSLTVDNLGDEQGFAPIILNFKRLK